MYDVKERPILAPFKGYWASQAFEGSRNEVKTPSASALFSKSKLQSSHLLPIKQVDSSSSSSNDLPDIMENTNETASTSPTTNPYNLSRRMSISVPNIPSLQLNGSEFVSKISNEKETSSDGKPKTFKVRAGGQSKSFHSSEEAFDMLTSIAPSANTGLVGASGSTTCLVTAANPTGKVSVMDTIDQLQKSLGHDIVMQVDSVEDELLSKMQVFQKNLNELVALRDICLESMKKIDGSGEETKSSIEEHFERFESLRAEFASIGQLEDRMEKARAKILEYSKRLELVQQRIDLREKFNMQRRIRKKYWQRTVLFISIAVLILAIVFKGQEWR